MSIELSGVAREKSTYGIPLTFTDEDGDAVTPNAITWSLLRPDGQIVNGRRDVAVETPASTVTIPLSGADLAVFSNDDPLERRLLVEWTYDGTLGTDLPGKEEVIFTIEDLLGVR